MSAHSRAEETSLRLLLTVTPGAAPCNGRAVLLVIENDNASFDASQAYAFTP